MKPNIFDIATKELTQDAFITWLLKFADEKNRNFDLEMNECGKMFVKELIRKQIKSFDEPITKVEAGRQWENIDVWAEVNEKYLIIIEDKTSTTYHSNQLERYKENSTKWCIENNYEIPICIYLKTGNESISSLRKIEEQGFAIFNRIDFISILEKFEKSSNNIYLDFFQRLKKLEKWNNEFEEKFIKDWNGNDWQGFFHFLEKHEKIESWDYVNNPSGGFWNALINWDYWGIYPAYLQLEEGKLCFKISTDPNEVKLPENTSIGEVRNDFYNLIMEKAKEFGLSHIRKPNRFGTGKYMTVAVVDKENWLGADESRIEKETIFKNLENYLDFLIKIIA